MDEEFPLAFTAVVSTETERTGVAETMAITTELGMMPTGAGAVPAGDAGGSVEIQALCLL